MGLRTSFTSFTSCTSFTSAVDISCVIAYVISYAITGDSNDASWRQLDRLHGGLRPEGVGVRVPGRTARAAPADVRVRRDEVHHPAPHQGKATARLRDHQGARGAPGGLLHALGGHGLPHAPAAGGPGIR